MTKMGSLGLDSLKESFTSLLQGADPRVLPEFLAWLDVTLTQYKLAGGLYSFCDYKASPSFPLQYTQISHQPSQPHTPNTTQLNHKPMDKRNQQSDKRNKRLSSQQSGLSLQTTNNESNLNDLSVYAGNSALARLLANNKSSPVLGSKLTLKVPSVPTTAAVYLNSPISQQGSPPPGLTAGKPESYSALRSLLSSSARIDLTEELSDRARCSDSEYSSKLCYESDQGEGGTYDCLACGKSFLHRSSFRRHLKIHQGVFSHCCDTCDRKFTRKEHFLRHKCALKTADYQVKEERDDINPYGRGEVLNVASPWVQNGPSSPVDMSSKWSDISSVSSGPASPQLYQPESRRKKAAPRKFVSTDASPQRGDYLSDLEESIYDGAVKTENGALDFSMKTYKEHSAADVLNKPQLSDTTLDLTNKQDNDSGEHGVIMSENRVTPVSHSDLTALTGGQSYQRSPPSGFRIGDLIENAVTKYHSIIEPSAPHLDHSATSKLDKFTREFHANNMPEGDHFIHSGEEAAPLITNHIHSVEKAASMINQEEYVHSVEKAATQMSDVKACDSNFLATETGTYQITTEDSDLTDTPNKVIKVVKQGNYLKLKKEAQLIDGELRFICPHCNKAFHRSSNFSRHMRIHRGVFSYICSACNRGFYRKEHFDKHKCYRKAMATTWERKTRVEMDREGENKSENGHITDEESHMTYDDGVMSQDDALELESQEGVLIAQNEH